MAISGILRRLLGDYGYYRIFTIDLPQPYPVLPDGVRILPVAGNDLALASDPELRDRAWYGGDDAAGFGLYLGDELVAIQWYWWGARYREKRNTWPLGEGGAKSVELYTSPACRGRGYAVLMKQYTAALMAERGFARLYSRIWHNNQPSIRVSQKCGWRQVGRYIAIHPFGCRIVMRLPF